MFRMPVDATLDLVLLEARHAPMLFSLVDDNRAHLRRYLPWVDGTRSVQDSVQYITASLEQFARSQSLQVGIFSGNTLAGMCGYHLIDWNNRRTGIGYWLAQGHQGKGLMTRAVRALTTHAFVSLGLHRLEIHAATENAKSRAVAERLGFTQEGIAKGAEWLHERWVDHAVYAMLPERWRG
ncbi:MAG: GNAT family N-acetyltransferase [Deltaproteobacteria bacterium]|nr:GNAT family N-acetyltransferase [Deltaproteobacteria bacterium]